MLAAVLGPGQVVTGAGIAGDYGHDEALSVLRPCSPAGGGVPASPPPRWPGWWPFAQQHRDPARRPEGSGTGLLGACVPVAGGAVISFERMNRILEIDVDNHVAVVQLGVTL